MAQGKVCAHCREVNPPDARECRSCGRFLIHAAGRDPADSQSGTEALGRPVVIAAALLLVTLFLPWFTVLVFNVSAVQLLSLSSRGAGVEFRGGGLFTLVRLLLYLLPLGCLAVVVLAWRDASVRLAGQLTGALPLAIFLLLFAQNTSIFSLMGYGFVMAIIAGVALLLFSRAAE